MTAVIAQAVLLAGGEGTRLRPLTHLIPKPVIPLVNRPFLHYQLELIEAAGITDAHILVGYKTDRVRAALGDRFGSVALHYIHEEEPLGTGGAVGNACRDLDGPAVVTNGDVLTDLDLAAVLAFHRARGGAGTIVLTRVEDPRRYGVIVTEPDGRIREFVEKPEHPPSNLINAGFYILEPSFIGLIPEGRSSIERDIFPKALAAGMPLYGYVHEGYWLDIGTLGSYAEASFDLIDGRLARFAKEAKAGMIASPLPPSTAWSVGRVIVGQNCTFGDRCTLDECIIFPGAAIGSHCNIDCCIIGPGATVEDEAILYGVVVMPGGEIFTPEPPPGWPTAR